METGSLRGFKLWKASCEAMGLDFWHLRFKADDKEAAFTLGSTGRLASHMFLVSVFGCFSTAAVLAIHIHNAVSVGQGKPLPYAEVAALVSRGAVAIIFLALTVIARYFRQTAARQARFFEYIVVILLALILFLLPFCERACMASIMTNIMGYSASSVGEYDWEHETRLLLFLDAWVTLAGLAPIRWSSVRGLYVWAICVYPIVLIVCEGHPIGARADALGVMTLLVFCAAVGKRKFEVLERRQFDMVAIGRPPIACSDSTESPQPSSGRLGRIAHVQGINRSATTESADIFDGSANVTGGAKVAYLERIRKKAQVENWLIASEDVSVHVSKQLGSGGFGIVMQGSLFESPVAIKLLGDRLQTNGDTCFDSLSTELRILRKLRHPNIVMFHGAIVDPQLGELALVLEMVSGPNLHTFIKRSKNPLSNRGAYMLSCDIARALQYLHARTPVIVHADLKPANILVKVTDVTPSAKLADFGLSQVMSSSIRNFGGTLQWLAPELLHSTTRPSPAVDVYGFGRIVLFMLSRSSPFSGWDSADIRRSLDSAQIPESSLHDDASGTFRYLSLSSEACCAVDVDSRPSMQDVCDALRNQEVMAGLTSELGGLPRRIWGDSHDSSRCSYEPDPAKDMTGGLLPWKQALTLLRQKSLLGDSQTAKPAEGMAKQAGSGMADKLAPISEGAMQALQTITTARRIVTGTRTMLYLTEDGDDNIDMLMATTMSL